MSAWSALLLGCIQGITEWIPLSSQGVIAFAAHLIDGASPADAIAIALWLHVGTALSAAVAMRGDIVSMLRQSRDAPMSLSAPLRFLTISTVMTALIGAPLFLMIQGMADRLGAGAMLLIGLAMIVTALVIRRRPWGGARGRDDLRPVDALLAGIVQAFAVVPGISRAGLTVTILLARGCAHREAVVLSVLMGIPASLGAGLLAALSSDTLLGWPSLVGTMSAAIVGAAAIRAILAWAGRVRLAPFVALTGVIIAVGALANLTL